MEKNFEVGHAGSLPTAAIMPTYGEQVDYFKNFRKLIEDIVSIPDSRDELIYKILCKEAPKIFRISKDEYFSSQKNVCVRARITTYYLLKKHTKYSARKIAKMFKTDHANVIRRTHEMSEMLLVVRTHEDTIENLTRLEIKLLNILNDG